jgi:hypothetical protein
MRGSRYGSNIPSARRSRYGSNIVRRGGRKITSVALLQQRADHSEWL